ncbi:MAG: ABC transporter ATP-binding protein [Desulfobaccales bacterium]|nr:ABC transporter ATP-binding protein [Desulfobaccales bacterium]
MATVIRVENLSKQYRLGVLGHGTLYRDLQSWWARLRGREDPNSPVSLHAGGEGGPADRIWALEDVSLEVKQGEVLGIIGRNGAGKSTLLKIIARITAPTVGEVKIRGRVASLLEVGTGFHPELTGRENIFLNGAILGMTIGEIKRKFDEIVDFSGVEKFIDTPVKRYSSGMYVRLAFAVAAHLDPEILVVDEVLAVGDAEFQKKCLGKMGDQAREGRTVLLVSHNMGSINQLCKQCLWLHEGQIRMQGNAPTVVESYLTFRGQTGVEPASTFPEDPHKPSQLRAARIMNSSGLPTQSFSCDGAVVIELLYQVHYHLKDLYGCLQVTKADGTPVMVSYSYDFPPDPLANLPVGSHLIRLQIPPRTLGHGHYTVQFGTASSSWEPFIVDDCGTVLSFSLDDLMTRKGNNRLGYFSTLLDWQVEQSTEVTH